MQWGVFLVPDGALADVPSFGGALLASLSWGLFLFSIWIWLSFWMRQLIFARIIHLLRLIRDFNVVYIGMTKGTLCKGHLFFYAGNTEES